MAEVQITFQDADAAGKTVRIINFTGQLDETNVDEEAKKIYKVIEDMPVPYLLLDFSQLTYINSKAIGYVTDWYSRASAKNGKIVIANPQPNILDILKVVGITQIISIHNSVEDAKLDFGGNPQSAPAPAPAETPVSSDENSQAAQ